MMYYYLAILIPSLVLIYVLRNRHSHNNTKNLLPLPPSPPSLPFIGHLHLLKKPYHRSLESLLSKYGPILRLQLGRCSLLVISSPQAAEECFTKSNDAVFANRPDFLTGKILGYNYTNLFWSSYGDHWRNLRRVTALEVFSTHSLQRSSAVRFDEVRFMARELVLRCGSGSNVNLNETFCKLMQNIVMRMVSGEKWVSGSLDDDLFVSKVGFMNLCDFVPCLRWVVGFNGLEKEMIAISKARDRFLQSLIDQVRMKTMKVKEEEKVMTKSIVEELLALQKTDPYYYTDDLVKGIILVMFTAGTETTARTMEWAMSLLLNNPTTFQTARREIDAHTTTQNRLVTDSDLPNFPYLRCIVNETLRLFPAAPLLVPHLSSSDTTVSGYHVPRGTVLLVNAWALHRDPNVWDQPLKFMPERFTNVGETGGCRFIPFGAGRRTCPGSTMAVRTVSLALATLIQCFDWERVEGNGAVDLTEESGGAVTMPKNQPLHAVCRIRPKMEMILFGS